MTDKQETSLQTAHADSPVRCVLSRRASAALAPPALASTSSAIGAHSCASEMHWLTREEALERLQGSDPKLHELCQTLLT